MIATDENGPSSIPKVSKAKKRRQHKAEMNRKMVGVTIQGRQTAVLIPLPTMCQQAPAVTISEFVAGSDVPVEPGGLTDRTSALQPITNAALAMTYAQAEILYPVLHPIHTCSCCNDVCTHGDRIPSSPADLKCSSRGDACTAGDRIPIASADHISNFYCDVSRPITYAALATMYAQPEIAYPAPQPITYATLR